MSKEKEITLQRTHSIADWELIQVPHGQKYSSREVLLFYCCLNKSGPSVPVNIWPSDLNPSKVKLMNKMTYYTGKLRVIWLQSQPTTAARYHKYICTYYFNPDPRHTHSYSSAKQIIVLQTKTDVVWCQRDVHVTVYCMLEVEIWKMRKKGTEEGRPSCLCILCSADRSCFFGDEPLRSQITDELRVCFPLRSPTTGMIFFTASY